MFGWKYKTGGRVKVGDLVLISKRLAKENKVEQDAVVCGLQGFITVQLSDGSKMDVDARMITLKWQSIN